jgi:uncharacterized protein YlxW (UPF0749 family)
VPEASAAPDDRASNGADPVSQLLGAIWDGALDPGYAAAASDAAPAGKPGRVRAATITGLVLIGLLLAVALAQTRAAAPAVARQREDLDARIRAQTAAYDATTRQVTALQAEVNGLKEGALAAGGQGDALVAELAALELQSGLVAVSGPGLQVTLDDATTPPAGTDASLDRVLDRDLQSVVNGLWAAGAEAVAVNGQRLTGLSAIRSAGDAILVDYRPLTRPYVVVAIGDPRSIQSSFLSGAGGQGLRTLEQAYGIRFSVQAVDRRTLPAASTGELRYARAKEAGS